MLSCSIYLSSPDDPHYLPRDLGQGVSDSPADLIQGFNPRWGGFADDDRQSPCIVPNHKVSHHGPRYERDNQR